MLIKEAKEMLESEGFLVKKKEQEQTQETARIPLKVLRNMNELEEWGETQETDFTKKMMVSGWIKEKGVDIPICNIYYYINEFDENIQKSMTAIKKEVSQRLEKTFNGTRFHSYFKLKDNSNKDEIIFDIVPIFELFEEDFDDIKYVWKTFINKIDYQSDIIDKHLEPKWEEKYK